MTKVTLAGMRRFAAPLIGFGIVVIGLRGLYESASDTLNQRGFVYRLFDQFCLSVTGEHPFFAVTGWVLICGTLIGLFMLAAAARLVTMFVHGGYSWTDVSELFASVGSGVSTETVGHSTLHDIQPADQCERPANVGRTTNYTPAN